MTTGGDSALIDWPGLLKWSIQHSDGTAPSRISEEDATFLKNAIRAAAEQIEDPYELVRQAVDKLNGHDIADRDTLAALSLIQQCVDEAAEISRDFAKVGALEAVLSRVLHEDPAISDLASSVLAFVLANNLDVQMAARELNALPLVMHRCNPKQTLKSAIEDDKEEGTQETAEKVTKISPTMFGLMASLVRNCPTLESEFIKEGGLALIASGLRSRDAKVQIKAATLFRHLTEGDQLTASVKEAKESKFEDLVEALISVLSHQREADIQFEEIFADLTSILIQNYRFPLSKMARCVTSLEKNSGQSDAEADPNVDAASANEVESGTTLLRALNAAIAGRLERLEKEGEAFQMARDALAVALKRGQSVPTKQTKL